jgi:1,4-dihydroxy-6-naphthoate synthase
MKLTVGFSTCPNDTFIFDALIHRKIDTEGLEFEPVLEDVEKLNLRALNGELDVTKVSYHAYFYLREKYALLNAGSALGNNCGPLLIARNPIDPSALSESRIGIPGKFTTANLLLQLYLGKNMNCREMIFSDIEGALLSKTIDAGVIIHESRFTYGSLGLAKIQDLGEFWESRTHLPIPLGGILIKKNLGEGMIAKFDNILKRSIQFAFDFPDSSKQYVKTYAQKLDDEVIQNHIDLYVNSFTLDLGVTGQRAVHRFIAEADKVLAGSQIA